MVVKTEYQEISRSKLFGKVTIKVSKVESKLDGTTIISETDLGKYNIDLDGEFMAFYINKPYSSETIEYEWR